MKPLPSVAQNLGNAILTGTKFGPESIPLLAQIYKKSTLCGNKCSELACWQQLDNLVRFLTFCTLPRTTTGKSFSEKPNPFWHTFGVQNPTLSGTLLENPTLCGTEIGQNGTLAILAYVYGHQWECPLRPIAQTYV